MTGPDHYAIAVRLLEWKQTRMAGHPHDVPPTPEQVARAQVHATLALAAATASAGRMPGETAAAWDKATGATR